MSERENTDVWLQLRGDELTFMIWICCGRHVEELGK
jgi:hypothetical protein